MGGRQLSPDHVDWLAGLPYPVTLTVDGFGEVVFCHATPRDDQEVVVVDFRLERWAEVLGDLPPEVMAVVCEHTHMPFTRLANTRQIINPGSARMPYGRQGAHWAILSGGAVEMRRTAFDVCAVHFLDLMNGMVEAGGGLRDLLRGWLRSARGAEAQLLETGPGGDAVALEALSPV